MSTEMLLPAIGQIKSTLNERGNQDITRLTANRHVHELR
jgi:hypothetical protein